MSYQVLVDENTSPRVAELLRGKNHEAAHVTEELEAGISDQDIADYATQNGYIVLTCDDDFLLPKYSHTVVRDSLPLCRHKTFVSESETPIYATLLEHNHARPYQSTSILYRSDETLAAYEIADRVDQVSEYVPDPTDLPGITNLGSW